MSKYIENINTLHNNVFALTPLLVAFYKNLPKQENNILLAYFVFPIVLHKGCLEKIKVIQGRAGLNKLTNDEEFMAGFEERFNYYKEITNRCLQYALECKWIEIDANMSVSVTDGAYMQTDARLNLSFKLVSQLHRIFRKNVQNTYILFGIKQL